jgi:hypothetical protein
LLRNERKKLKETDADYLQQFERINKAIDEQNDLLNSLSDKQKKAKANVGNYTESVKQAIDESEAFNKILGGINDNSSVFITATRGVFNQLKQIKQQFKEAEGTGSKFKTILKGGLGSAVALAGGLFAGSMATDRQVATNVEKIASKIGNGLVAGFEFVLNYVKQVFLPTIENIGLEIQKAFSKATFNTDDVEKYQQQIDKNKESIDGYSGSFSKLFDTISKGSELVEKQIDLQNELIDKTNLYAVTIQKLNGQAEVQSEIAGDNTRSFDEMNDALIKSLKLTEKRIAQETELAKIQLDNIASQVKLVFLNKGKDITDKQIKSLAFIKDENLQKTLGVELQQKLTDAIVNYNQKQIELNVASIKTTKEARNIESDRFERELDYLIDAYDSTKTANERIVANDRKTFEERKRIIEETRQLADGSFKYQEKTIQHFTKSKIDLQKLVEMTDSEALYKEIEGYKLSDKWQGRLLEIIRERRLLNQDIADMQNDIALKELEMNQRIIDSQSKINDLKTQEQTDLNNRLQAQEQKIQDANVIYRVDKLKELTEEQFKIQNEQAKLELERQKEQAKKQIVEKEELNAKLLELDAEYQNKVLLLERDKNDKIKELNRQQFASEVKNANDIAQNLLSSLDTYLQQKKDRQDFALQKDIERGQRNIDRQNDLAQRGLNNQLAFEEQQQAKRELQQKKEQERRQRQQEAIQLVELYFNNLSAYLQQPGANPDLAGGKALQQTLLERVIAKGLVQFFNEGTEYVLPKGQARKGVGTGDYIPAMLAEGEAVINADANIKNKGVANALNKGIFDQLYIPRAEINYASDSINTNTAQNMYNSMLLQTQIETKKYLKELAERPTQHISVDAVNNIVESYISNNKRVNIIHKKQRRII